MAPGLDRQHQAGPDGPAVHQDGAGATNTVLAAEVGPRQVAVLAQEIGQRLARLHRVPVLVAVDREGHFQLTHCPSASLIALSNARVASTAASSRRYAAEAWTSPGGSRSSAASRPTAPRSTSRALDPTRAVSAAVARCRVPPTPNRAAAAL